MELLVVMGGGDLVDCCKLKVVSMRRVHPMEPLRQREGEDRANIWEGDRRGHEKWSLKCDPMAHWFTMDHKWTTLCTAIQSLLECH